MHVDDSADDRLLLAHCATGLPIELSSASSGFEALEKISNAPKLPDVILLDIKMPALSGLELLQRLKRDTHLAPIPVIMLSSSTFGLDVTTARHLGAHAYCLKPAGTAEYREILAKIYTGWASAELPVIWPTGEEL